MNSEFPNEEIFPSPTQPTTPIDQTQSSPPASSPASPPASSPASSPSASSWEEPKAVETQQMPSHQMPPQVVSPVAVAYAPPLRKSNRLAFTVIGLCALLIVILCLVSRDFRAVFFLASAIWFVLHAIIRLFKL